MSEVQQFLKSFRQSDDMEPGLIEKPDGTVWLVNPDGSETQLPGSADSSSFKGVYTNNDGDPTDGPYASGDFYVWVAPSGDVGFLIFVTGDGGGWKKLVISPTNLTVENLTVDGVLDFEGYAGSLESSGALSTQIWTPNLELHSFDYTIDPFNEAYGIVLTGGVTVTLPTLTAAFQCLTYSIQNKSDIDATVSSEAAATALGSNSTAPLTVVEGVNDTFIYTPSGGSPETFTVAPGTYNTLDDVADAMAAATGSVSGEPFSTYATVALAGLLPVAPLACYGVTLGAAQNGDALNFGPTDVLAEFGFTDGQLFANGGHSQINGSDTLTLPTKSAAIVQWDGVTWNIVASNGLA